MENQKEFEPIDLMRYIHQFLKVLRWTWLPILVVSLLCGVVQYSRSYNSYSPYYQATALLTVRTGENSGDIFNDDLYYDSTAVNEVVSTMPQLLSTDFMRDLIMEELGISYIPGSISVSAITDTALFELTVTGSDPQSLCDVVYAVLAAYPKAAVYMTDNTQLVVIDEPVVPTTPANSRSTISTSSLIRSMAKVILMGLALTLGLSLLKQTVGSEKELKELITVPLAAALPQIRTKQRRKNTEVLIRAADDPDMEEAIRSLRTRVCKALEEREGKVVLLTSTIPGEGKTTTATNLALSLANDGHRTLLLDADLRNQTIGRLLGDSRSYKGLMAMLKDPDLPLSKCVRQAPDTNLSYISGDSTTKRHYRIEPNAMARVLDTLKAQYDYVVVDTPPCSVVSDTATLSRYADSIFYVVRLDHANKAQIVDTMLNLHQQDITLTGCILNGAPRSSHSYGYGYGYGYGRKYGYGYGRKN